MSQAAELGPERAEEEASRIAHTGRLWAQSVRTSLNDEGRPACGGWPGTLSEARARLLCDASRSPSERERLTRLLYDSARAFWLEHRDPLVQDPKHS